MNTFFIRRPHALEQFRLRARFPTETPLEELETILRQHLENAELIADSRRDAEYVIRISVPGRSVVYAVVQRAPADKPYMFVVPTVYDQHMYQRWTRRSKLGTIRDTLGENHPVLTETKLYLRYPKPVASDEKNAYCVEYCLEYVPVDQVPGRIMCLMQQGVRFDSIEVLRQVQPHLDIHIPLPPSTD